MDTERTRSAFPEGGAVNRYGAASAHLSSRHVLKGHVSVGQLAGGDAEAVDVGAKVVALEVLSGNNHIIIVVITHLFSMEMQ